jgi:toxin-antitoxin system PIN domain toxin
MIVVDVNVLIAAFRSEHDDHSQVRSWFLDVLSNEDAVVIPDLSWVGFLRIVTNSRIFDVPATMDEALGFLQAVMAASSYRSAPRLNKGWGGFAELVDEARVAGNLVPDAYLAAVARGLACPIASMDRDFRRFAGLALRDPTAI